MKKLLILLFIGIILSCVSSKRTVFLMPPSDKTSVQKIDLAAYEAKYEKYDGVYLFWEHTFEHVGAKDLDFLGSTSAGGGWYFYDILKRKYLILNPDVQTLSTFELKTIPGAKLGNLYLYVTYPDGKVKKFNENDLKKNTDGNKSQIYKFAYPNIQKGCIIEEGYEIIYNIAFTIPPLSHDIPLQFIIPCEKLSFSYAYPDWWKIQVKKIAKDSIPHYQVKKDPKNRKTTITYLANNVPALQIEKYSPFFKEVVNYFEFMITDLQMLSRSYKSEKSWNDL